VFSNASITIERGEKVAFVGKNGEGKSTMVKAIMGQIDFAGELALGHNLKIGYFAQNEASLLDEEKTVFKTIDDVAVGDIRTKLRDILGAFMFGRDDSDKLVKVLSGGERTRLAMIKLLLEPVNFLILDEPTNHLDLRTKDVLKEAILAFDGTVIVVSHDREFLDGLVSKVYEFGGGVVREYLGGIYDFLKKKDQTSLDNISLVQQKTNARADAMKLETVSEGKVSYEQQKERAKLAKKAEKRIKDAELTVEKIENEIGAIEQQLATPEGATSVNLFEQHAALKKQLDKAVEEWELAMEAYSEFD
jgi:ATP-binding cassette subfamily F protein 3